MKEYEVVGRRLPSVKLANPPLYKMRIFAPNTIVAKSRFWYFCRALKKLKKTHGEIVSVRRVIHNEFLYHRMILWSFIHYLRFMKSIRFEWKILVSGCDTIRERPRITCIVNIAIWLHPQQSLNAVSLILS